MAYRNINILQYPDNLTYILQSYTNEYMYESLSNLGQRFSLKGDGITTESFNIANIFNIDENVENTIGKIYIEDNEAYVSLVNIETGEIIETQNIKYAINTALYTDTNIKLDFKINGIDYYNENALIYATEKTLTVCSIGCDTDNGKVELNIDKFNINTNTLEESLKLVNTGDDDKYNIYHLYAKDDKYYLDYSYIYKKTLSYTTFGEYLENIYYNYVKEYYMLYNDISIEAIYNEITSTGYYKTFDSAIEISYNNNEYEGFYSVEHTEVNSILNHIYNQVIYMYPFMFEYYCDYIYKYDNNQLKKFILYKLFYKIFVTSNVEFIKDFQIYVPINYSFDYYCNSYNKYYIYTNETPISVYYTRNKLTTKFVSEYYSSPDTNSVIIAHNDVLENIVLYKFSVNYNPNNSDLINNVVIQELYSTPYIQNDYWYINGKCTNCRAVGVDAGNPNIIMVYVDNISDIDDKYQVNDNYKILTNTDSDILGGLSWKKTTVKTELLKTLNINPVLHPYLNDTIVSNPITSYTLVPYLGTQNSAIKDKFKHSIIVNIASINNITNVNKNVKNDIKNLIGSNTVITTFWTYNTETEEFENILNPNSDYSLTLGDINNTNNIIANQVKSVLDNTKDTTTFTQLLFDGVYNLKNANLVNKQVIYPAITNKQANSVITELHNKVNYNDYNNDLSMRVEYYSNTKGNIYTNQFLNATLINNDTQEYGFEVPTTNIFTLSNLYKLYSETSAEINALAYEYIPSDNMPVFNFSEVLLENTNNINKSNILSFTNSGEIYYGYIGTSNEDTDKSVLHIGTSNLNTTIGTSTLCNPKHISKFKKHNEISIDFNTIKFNANTVKNDSKFTYTTGHNVHITDNIHSTQCILKYNTDQTDTIQLPINTTVANYTIDTDKTKPSNIIFIDDQGYSTLNVSDYVRLPLQMIIDSLGIIDKGEGVHNITANVPILSFDSTHHLLVKKKIIGQINMFKCDIDYYLNDNDVYNINITCPEDEIMAFPITIQYQIN